MKNDIVNNLNIMIKDPKCELEYNKDYELLLATILSAQCTDKRVNEVTRVLFSKYDLNALKEAENSEIEDIIRSCGSYSKKASYLIETAKKLVDECDGKVPCDREYLEQLKGVGRKTCNVVLANIYNVPTIAVDTHVMRVSKRLELCNEDDDVLTIEKKLQKLFPESDWNRINDQLILFGRYICKSVNPNCNNCLFKNCKHRK